MPTASTRQVYQCLRDAAMGVRALTVLSEPEPGLFEVAIDDWRLTLLVDAEGLARCIHCTLPDGQAVGLDDWQRYGSNPADLLSLWERQRIEGLLTTP